MTEPGTLLGCPPRAYSRLFDALTRIQLLTAQAGAALSTAGTAVTALSAAVTDALAATAEVIEAEQASRRAESDLGRPQ